MSRDVKKIYFQTFVINSKIDFIKQITKQKEKEKKNHGPYKHSIVVTTVSFVGISLHCSIEPTVVESRTR
jgi:hypothetical protein